MDSSHIPIEAVKAYLLGQLADEEAAAIEQRYFVNQACLLQMQTAERMLIENYQDGALTPHEAQQFETRYLRIPALKRIVDQVARERNAAGHRTPARRRVAWFAWAGAILCAGALCGWIYLKRGANAPPAIAKMPVQSSLPPVTLRLTPGVTMGAGGHAAGMNLPPEHTPVQLIAELPGLRTPTDCGARLAIVGADGRWTEVWSAKPARTISREGQQELTFLLNPATLRAGDYILEVTAPDGRVRETYLFHVSTPP